MDTKKGKFPKEVRLRTTAQFRRVFDARHCVSDAVFIVFVLPNELEHSRLGLSVSRKVGGAVVRNRWKRVLREAFRKNQAAFSVSVDIVVVPQKDAPPPSEAVAEKSFVNSVTKIIRQMMPSDTP